jgi:hypothetical protein
VVLHRFGVSTDDGVRESVVATYAVTGVIGVPLSFVLLAVALLSPGMPR